MKRKITFLIMLILLIILSVKTFASENQASDDLSVSYHNIEAVFKNKTESSNNSQILIDKLKDYKILLIPGVLSESMIGDSPQKFKVTRMLGEYFQDHMDWLKKSGIDYERVIVESESSAEFNAQIIIDHINNSNKPVILFTHSKGGIDALYALLEDKGIHQKVKGWITSQTPFYGSPIAEIVDSWDVSRSATAWLMEYLGGGIKGLKSLTVGERNTFMNDESNISGINEIIGTIPTISFASMRRNVFGWDSPLELLRDAMKEIEGDNDGVVSIESAKLPGADYIVTKGVDHLLSVLSIHGIKENSLTPWSSSTANKWKYNRLANFQSLLSLLVQKIN